MEKLKPIYPVVFSVFTMLAVPVQAQTIQVLDLDRIQTITVLTESIAVKDVDPGAFQLYPGLPWGPRCLKILQAAKKQMFGARIEYKKILSRTGYQNVPILCEAVRREIVKFPSLPGDKDILAQAGQSLSLSVATSPSKLQDTSLRFQWFKNDVPVSGATSDTYVTGVLSSDKDDVYHVQVSNPRGASLSPRFILQVEDRIHRPTPLGMGTVVDLLGTGSFSVSFDLVPEASPVQNDMVGLRRRIVDGNDPGGSLVVAGLRMNNLGQFDVKYSGGYRADQALNYVAGEKYKVRMDFDLSIKKYSVYVNDTVLAKDVSIAIEQGRETLFPEIAVDALLLKGGAFSIAAPQNMVLQLPPGLVSADNLFKNESFAQQTGAFTARFHVTPVGRGVDALVSLAFGNPTYTSAGFLNLDAIVRWNPAGFIDAMDGGNYKAFQAVRYEPGVTYKVLMEVDVATNRYNVFLEYDLSQEEALIEAGLLPVQVGEVLRVQIGRNYAFRSSARSSLQNLIYWSKFDQGISISFAEIAGVVLIVSD